MKITIFLMMIFLLFGCASTHQNKSLTGMPPDAPVQQIRVTAEKYKYTPEEIHIKKGTHVVIELESLDVTHGFRVSDLGIDAEIPEKSKTTVEFYAAKSGTYPFRCSHFCGIGHFGMTGKIIVE